MATLRYNGKEIPVAEDWRISELIEAENALNLDMEKAKGGGKMALIFYISIRRSDKQTPQHVLADQVMRMEIASIGSDEEDETPAPLGNEGEVSIRSRELSGAEIGAGSG